MINIVLVGMPGCGKSTVGVILAKVMGMEFCDTDIVIQQKEGRKLQDIINTEGNDAFLKCNNRSSMTASSSNFLIRPNGMTLKYNSVTAVLCGTKVLWP